jgi:hypothetical protein
MELFGAEHVDIAEVGLHRDFRLRLFSFDAQFEVGRREVAREMLVYALQSSDVSGAWTGDPAIALLGGRWCRASS